LLTVELGGFLQETDMDEGVAYNNWMECEAEIKRLAIALRIKTEEHQCCAEDLISLSKSEQDGWKEAAIAWSVCASIHENWAKGKDALYSTRHADFEKHADDARRKLLPNACNNAPSSACGAVLKAHTRFNSAGRHWPMLVAANALGQGPCAAVCARSPGPECYTSGTTEQE
jgi:hypothetical protein